MCPVGLVLSCLLCPELRLGEKMGWEKVKGLGVLDEAVRLMCHQPKN